MDELPATYLDWLRGQEWINDWTLVEKYLEENKASIDSELGSKYNY